MINALFLIIGCLINRNFLWYGFTCCALFNLLSFYRMYKNEPEPLKRCVALLIRPIDGTAWLLTVLCLFKSHYLLAILSLIFGVFIVSVGSSLIPSDKDESFPPFPPQTQESKERYIIYLYNHFYKISIWNVAIPSAIYLYVIIYFFNFSHLLSASLTLLFIAIYVSYSKYILKLNGANYLGNESFTDFAE